MKKKIRLSLSFLRLQSLDNPFNLSPVVQFLNLWWLLSVSPWHSTAGPNGMESRLTHSTSAQRPCCSICLICRCGIFWLLLRIESAIILRTFSALSFPEVFTSSMPICHWKTVVFHLFVSCSAVMKPHYFLIHFTLVSYCNTVSFPIKFWPSSMKTLNILPLLGLVRKNTLVKLASEAEIYWLNLKILLNKFLINSSPKINKSGSSTAGS